MAGKSTYMRQIAALILMASADLLSLRIGRNRDCRTHFCALELDDLGKVRAPL